MFVPVAPVTSMVGGGQLQLGPPLEVAGNKGPHGGAHLVGVHHRVQSRNDGVRGDELSRQEACSADVVVVDGRITKCVHAPHDDGPVRPRVRRIVIHAEGHGVRKSLGSMHRGEHPVYRRRGELRRDIKFAGESICHRTTSSSLRPTGREPCERQHNHEHREGMVNHEPVCAGMHLTRR